MNAISYSELPFHVSIGINHVFTLNYPSTVLSTLLNKDCWNNMVFSVENTEHPLIKT